MKKTKKIIAAVAMIAIMATVLSVNAFAANEEAIVNSYMLNVRAGDAIEYTIIDVAYEGNRMEVLKRLPNGWVQVKFNGQIGYASSLFLTFVEPTVTQTYTAPANTAVAASTTAATTTNARSNAVIRGNGVNMRSGPSMNSDVVDVLNNDEPVQVNGCTGSWYEVVHGSKTGYIYGDFIVRNGETVTYTVTTAVPQQTTPVVSQPAAQQPVTTSTPETTQPVPVTPAPATPAPATPAPAASSVSGQAIVNTAMKYIGVKYVWAGTSPETGFDCSGLVYYVYGQHGITLNRVAQSMYYNGTAADLNNLQPGDILLFGSSVYNIWHAGIYVGNGMFIHSPHSGATVCTQPLSELYGYRLVAARRIV